MTPMTGTYVNCVAVRPEQLTWDVSVPMPAANLGAQGAALAFGAPKITDTARARAESAQAQQQRHHEVVAHHRRDGNGLDDHHAGRR